MKTKNIISFNCHFLIYILLSCFLLSVGCSKPIPTDKAYDQIDISLDPIQIKNEYRSFTIKIKKGAFLITPVAEYKISAMVVNKKNYHYGWNAELAPVDLALVWGKLAEPEYAKYMRYSQSNRWYYYRYKSDAPFDNSFIISRSSNNHIIPSNNNILKAVKTIKKKDKIYLEGYLVRLKGNYKNRECWWNSSLSRSDTGNGSCELFYIVKIRINNLIYK
jgi:hypothetical protein